VLRVEAPECASHAQPGSFVHLTCDPAIPMRRPLSIMRVDAERDGFEILYKCWGLGCRLWLLAKLGRRSALWEPIGHGFTPHPERPRALLIGGGVGIPPMVFLADRLRARTDAAWQPLVLMGSEIPFPFRTRPSKIFVSVSGRQHCCHAFAG